MTPQGARQWAIELTAWALAIAVAYGLMLVFY